MRCQSNVDTLLLGKLTRSVATYLMYKPSIYFTNIILPTERILEADQCGINVDVGSWLARRTECWSGPPCSTTTLLQY